MTKSLIAAILMVSSVASADVTTGNKPMVFRASANVYSIPGEGKVYTNDCTVTANGMRAVLSTERGKGFITFLDRDGQEEGQCELRKVITLTPVTITVVNRPTHKRNLKIASK